MVAKFLRLAFLYLPQGERSIFPLDPFISPPFLIRGGEVKG